ncbi:MAG: NAD+ synthase [Chloroflexi bacterium]|nr:NAD+ synthase [Chloroflexota bacterium]
MTALRIALAQINTTVGDLDTNAQKIRVQIDHARDVGADLVLFPEMGITGYPPEDLLLKPSFVEASHATVRQLASVTTGLTAILGFVEVADDVYNAAAVLHDGALAGVYRKHFLPTYGVFDEDRYFRSGTKNPVFVLDDIVIGVSICEDIWYPDGPPQEQATEGAQLLLNISASPYHAGKCGARERMLATRAADNVAVVAMCNLVGGQDELVFDGGSVVFDERGELLARGAQFDEDFVLADIDLTSVFRQRLHDPRWRKQPTGDSDRIKLTNVRSTSRQSALPGRHTFEPMSRLSEIYHALVLGTRDYVRKNGFHQVTIGLSGGIDSALVACIAADALGPENVVGVAMPSQYSADYSQTDAELLAQNLGCRFLVIPIEQVFQAYLDVLARPFGDAAPDITEENLQARTRGNLLMALSNKFGWMVLTTGNKSEMSVGYATLYGDMAGGFAVIKDVPKTLVYELARWRNTWDDGPTIPERILTRPPSAELRPDQKDTDSLPPYEVLDPILRAYVEEDQSLLDIAAQGFDEAVVRRVISMVDRNEYKRRQAPPGVKITSRAFGRDRRLPITNKFRDK